MLRIIPIVTMTYDYLELRIHVLEGSVAITDTILYFQYLTIIVTLGLIYIIT